MKNDPDSGLYFLFDGEIMTMFVKVSDKTSWQELEKLRKKAAQAFSAWSKNKLDTTTLHDLSSNKRNVEAFAEAWVLTSYEFNKYKTDKKANTIKYPCLDLNSPHITKDKLTHINAKLEGVFIARDLVNEPYSTLNALTIADEFKKLGKESGFEVEVWNETKILAQKMGGLISVNKGSITPPTFTIMEYKPKKPVNKKPLVLVGKGVVYDTGGLSLKPTPNSMDYMKCDMGGAATVAGLMCAIAKSKMDIHVIGLVPATDNRPGDEAYAPGDVITMYNGNTVEVKNTDAEGRLILADALHYAKKLKPDLVIDFATLTGSAVRAIGHYASAVMGNANEKIMKTLYNSGLDSGEKVIEFPLWEEYAEELKSDIADFSNLGKGEGGQISAGKFLEKFTDYPWVHLDIAGTAFAHSSSGHIKSGGTGVGVSLILDFLNKNYNQ